MRCLTHISPSAQEVESALSVSIREVGSVSQPSRFALTANACYKRDTLMQRSSAMYLRFEHVNFPAQTSGASRLPARTSPRLTIKAEELRMRIRGTDVSAFYEKLLRWDRHLNSSSWNKSPLSSTGRSSGQAGRQCEALSHIQGTSSSTSPLWMLARSWRDNAENACLCCGREHGELRLTDLPRGFCGPQVEQYKLDRRLACMIAEGVSDSQIRRFRQFVGLDLRPPCWHGFAVITCGQSRGGCVQVGFSPTIIATGELWAIDELGTVREVSVKGYEYLMGLPFGYTDVEGVSEHQRKSLIGEGIVPQVIGAIAPILEQLLEERR